MKTENNRAMIARKAALSKTVGFGEQVGFQEFFKVTVDVMLRMSARRAFQGLEAAAMKALSPKVCRLL